jgi:hypothetical protein
MVEEHDDEPYLEIMITPTTSSPIALDLAYVRSPAYVPERGLLAAILEMAVRDLHPDATYIDRISAINWFNGVKAMSIHENRFTFADVCLYLDLGERELRTIKALVRDSIKYEAIRPRILPK